MKQTILHISNYTHKFNIMSIHNYFIWDEVTILQERICYYACYFSEIELY